MRAVRYHEYGDEDVLTLEDGLEKPTPDANQVLVQIEAASINPIDTYLREGNVPPANGLPHVGGSDMAGVVEAVGDDVSNFSEGDRVFATGLGIFSPGTYAEYTVVSENMLAHLPEEVSFQEGAAAAMAFATSWRALIGRGDLSMGDVCLVHGASGGVGHAGIQVAAQAGGYVIGTAREGEAASMARSMGADAVVDYRSDNLIGDLEAAADGREIDVVLEPHADANIEADLERLADGGRIVIIGEESPIEIPPGPSMTAKQADADLRFMSLAASPDVQAPILQRVALRLADKRFTVEIDSVFDLDELPAAHEKLMSSGVMGKIVIDPTI
ncbi:NADPH2:quinone reductase [Halogranum amylolyticum]|uniref:NADPH2:quinone reductase n=1 Tax=Halogranum amylolyticum TaxID=660520 RepID=A0A1H8VMW7_9EURY|nr:NADPH:quinone reductase [Halogranum amylolyticum]SEP16792.1 NADPH2:quinone reductase [Halogranum amylolyticum]